jgi:hypothetical protein
MRALACGLMLLCGAGSSFAQTISDGRLWVNLTVQERAGTESPWRWYFELQGRGRDGAEDLDQMLVRPALGYDLTPRSSLWAGYGYTPSYPPNADVSTEHRAWQQYLWAGPGLGSLLQWRSRLEERSIEGNDRLAWRYRQLWRLARRLSSNDRGPSFVAWDELFLHLNDTARTASGFDQNRAFAGVGFGAGPFIRVEVGYLNQAIRSASGPNRRNHVLLAFANATY